jgi:hypothetical protein
LVARGKGLFRETLQSPCLELLHADEGVGHGFNGESFVEFF